MPEPSLRDLVGDIREALERHSREELIEILTYIFKEYVVEGPAPISSPQPVVRDDMTGLNFAEAIRTLQLRLDLPELALFEVTADRVFVRLGGQRLLVEAQASRPEPAPAPMASPTPPAPPPSTSPPSRDSRLTTPGVAVEELPTPVRRPANVAGTPMPTPAPGPAAHPAPAAANSPSTTPASGTGPTKEEQPKTGEGGNRFKLPEVD
jgi:hypothetical protein